MATGRETAQLFDLMFKHLIRLSSTAVVQFINGLFGTDYPVDSTVEYPGTEHVSRKLKKLLSDTVIVINGRHVYHIEAQIGEDENIAVRVFEYGFAEGLRTKTTDDAMITIKFPAAKIIFWETTTRTPDTVTLRLEFPDGGHYEYKVDAFKFLEYSIEELEARKMAILLPFYVLKLRKQAVAAKTSDRRRELSAEMQKILNELSDTVEHSAKAGVINETDMWTVLEKINQMFKELYIQYPEFEEVNKLIEWKVKNQWEEVAEAAAEAATEAVAKKMLSEGQSPENVSRWFDMPIDKVIKIKEGLNV